MSVAPKNRVSFANWRAKNCRNDPKPIPLDRASFEYEKCTCSKQNVFFLILYWFKGPNSHGEWLRAVLKSLKSGRDTKPIPLDRASKNEEIDVLLKTNGFFLNFLLILRPEGRIWSLNWPFPWPLELEVSWRHGTGCVGFVVKRRVRKS